MLRSVGLRQDLFTDTQVEGLDILSIVSRTFQVLGRRGNNEKEKGNKFQVGLLKSWPLASSLSLSLVLWCVC